MARQKSCKEVNLEIRNNPTKDQVEMVSPRPVLNDDRFDYICNNSKSICAISGEILLTLSQKIEHLTGISRPNLTTEPKSESEAWVSRVIVTQDKTIDTLRLIEELIDTI